MSGDYRLGDDVGSGKKVFHRIQTNFCGSGNQCAADLLNETICDDFSCPSLAFA